jgi:hypothetical protein
LHNHHPLFAMVAERRERKAAPTSFIPSEPAGKGKAVVARRNRGGGGATTTKKKGGAAAVIDSSSASAAVNAVNNVNSNVAAVTVSSSNIAPVGGGGGDGSSQGQTMSTAMHDDGATEQHQEAIIPSTTSLPIPQGGAGPIESSTGEQLFCICMDVDDGTPMIFCEACENW